MEGNGALSTVSSAALSIFFLLYIFLSYWNVNREHGSLFASENKKDETVEVFFFFLSLEIMLSCLLKLICISPGSPSLGFELTAGAGPLRKARVCVPVRVWGSEGRHCGQERWRDKRGSREPPPTQGILAANDLGWSRGVLALESGRVGTPEAWLPQLCVTAQLRDQPLMLWTSEHQSCSSSWEGRFKLVSQGK